ncbi:MAG: hypothetical protein ABGZ35_16445 [Planctomycetaceae bacterium]
MLRRTSLFGTVAVLLGISLSAGAQETVLNSSLEELVQQTQANPVGFSSILGDKSCGAGCGTEGCGRGGCRSGCGTCFNWSEDTWLKVGAGIRTSYNSGAAQDFKLNNARLYFNGQGHERIGFELNTDINGAQGFGAGSPVADEMRILDAILKVQLSDNTHFWMGRMLPPSDRSNLSGPFYLNAWNFPFAQFGYPNIFQGRDDGAVLWGEQGGGAFKWQVGAFEGESAGGPNFIPNAGADNLMFSGRVVVNLLDPEPGYYNSSTYYGEKDILAIGAALMHRPDSNGPNADYTGWNLDALFETKLSNGGVVTLETAYYDFDDSGVTVPASTLPPSLGSRQGNSYFMLASYMFAEECCIFDIAGKFQVMGRYQEYDRELLTAGGVPAGTDDQTDLQLNYVMFGHNARVSAIWSHLNAIGGAATSSDTFTLGAQVQF